MFYFCTFLDLWNEYFVFSSRKQYQTKIMITLHSVLKMFVKFWCRINIITLNSRYAMECTSRIVNNYDQGGGEGTNSLENLGGWYIFIMLRLCNRGSSKKFSCVRRGACEHFLWVWGGIMKLFTITANFNQPPSLTVDNSLIPQLVNINFQGVQYLDLPLATADKYTVTDRAFCTCL